MCLQHVLRQTGCSDGSARWGRWSPIQTVGGRIVTISHVPQDLSSTLHAWFLTECIQFSFYIFTQTDYPETCWLVESDPNPLKESALFNQPFQNRPISDITHGALKPLDGHQAAGLNRWCWQGKEGGMEGLIRTGGN